MSKMDDQKPFSASNLEYVVEPAIPFVVPSGVEVCALMEDSCLNPGIFLRSHLTCSGR